MVAASTDPAARRSSHLYQVDLIRLLTFSAVIAVHSIDFTQPASSELAAGSLMLLQFGRAVFFALTGFVLVYSTKGRRLDTLSFWRRRFPYVLVPYLVWTVIYYVFGELTSADPQLSWGALLGHVAGGDAQYHLYFLLVTMQLYLVFPLVLPFVRATAHRAWLVLGVVGAFDLVWMALLQYERAPSGWVGWFWPRSYELLPTYAIYALIGCYVALHLERVNAFVARRHRGLVAGAVAAIVLAELAYVAQLGGRPPRVAAAVLQPAMMLTSLGAMVLLFVFCTRWAAGPARGRRLVEEGSDLSFGVYLAHPLVLSILLMNGFAPDGQWVPAGMATLLAIVLTAAGATLISMAARRTPLSLPLTGRPRRRRSPLPSSASAQAASSPLAPSPTTMAS